ncbi:hypothetical protein ACFW2V_02370 [Streptomyces sp. NPDC058947]|uniref:hypothetical protein n=1 Tax=Streptomyces sp. NPDC058947 TaxID=3346675 RepID=UPI00368C1C9D
MNSHIGPGRYHVTLIVDSRPMMQGWWGSEAVARGKFREWVGGRGKAGVRITLVDEDTGTLLTSWPEEA